MKMNKRNRFLKALLCVTLCLLTVLCLASCNASSKTDKGDFYPMEDGAAPENGFVSDGKGDVAGTLPERKIIKTYNLTVETKTFDESLQALMSELTQLGGYVESSDVRNQSLNSSSTEYSRYAVYTLRIPAENADAFVNSVGNSFHVTGHTSGVQDVSETYYSIEAILEELYAERDSLLAMMESLDSRNDYNFWLTLQQRLSEVKQEIAVYQAQLKNYDGKVAYSTVRLSVTEVVTYTAKAANGRFGSRISAAFRDSWSDFAMGCQNFAVWFVSAIPTVLVLGVIAVVLILVMRRAFGKKKGRGEPPSQPPVS